MIVDGTEFDIASEEDVVRLNLTLFMLDMPDAVFETPMVAIESVDS